MYGELLDSSGAVPPRASSDVEHVFHLYVVQVDERERVIAELAQRGIGAGIHYPTPIHLQEAYRDRGFGPGAFPATEAAAKRVLSLPMYPELTEAGVRRVADALGEALSAGAARA